MNAAGMFPDRGGLSLFDKLFLLATALALAGFHPEYYTPQWFKWLGIALLAALILPRLALFAREKQRVEFDLVDICVGIVLGYVAVSLLWSADARAGIESLVGASMCAAVFSYLKDHATPALLRALCATVAVSTAAVLLVAVWHDDSAGGFFNANFVAEFILLALPFICATAVLYRTAALRIATTALIGSLLVYLLAFNTSKIEFLVLPGVAASYLSASAWRRSRRLAVTVILMCAAAPGLLVFHYWEGGAFLAKGFGESIVPRLAIDFDTFLMWLDRPIAGHGAGGFNAVFQQYQERHLAYPGIQRDMFRDRNSIAGAAHNEYLQYLANFGLVGLCAALTLALALLRRIPAPAHRDTLFWTGIAVTAVWMLEALVEFPLQNPATAILSAFGLGLVAYAGKPVQPVCILSPGRIWAAALPAVGLGAAIAALCGAASFHLSQLHFARAMRSLEAHVAEIAPGNMDSDWRARAFSENLAAYRLYPLDKSIRRELFVTITRWFKATGIPPFSAEEANRIFAISQTAGYSTYVMIARIEYLLNSRTGSSAEAESLAEAARWLEHLKRTASRTTDVWIMDAYYALLVDQSARAWESLNRAMLLGPNPSQRQLVERMREMTKGAESASAHLRQSADRLVSEGALR